MARGYQINYEYANAQATILGLCKKLSGGIYIAPDIQTEAVSLMIDPKIGFNADIIECHSKKFKDVLKQQLMAIRNPQLKAQALVSALLLPQTFFGRVFYTSRPTLWRQTPTLENSKRLQHIAQELIKTDAKIMESIQPWLKEVLSNPVERTTIMCAQLEKLNKLFYLRFFPTHKDGCDFEIELEVIKRYES